jgi:hypothetical protein
MNESEHTAKMFPIDAVSVFIETAKNSGRLVYDPHEAYNSEIEKRLDRKAD